ncbi:MAG: hypothetical protein RLZZ531_657 [Bacteroidota bacterium]|jgi:hypothetical protein
MNYLVKFKLGRLLMMSLLFSSHFVFSQKAYVEPEVYVPVPIEEQPYFNDDQLALEKAQEISDFQMRIYAHAATSNQMAKLESTRSELDTKCKKLCPNYPGTNVLDADRRLIERWVLDFPEEVDFFSQVLNTLIFRLGESN